MEQFSLIIPVKCCVDSDLRLKKERKKKHKITINSVYNAA